MKKRIVLLILICILLLSFFSCSRYMSLDEFSKYSVLDYNVIWDQAEHVIFIADDESGISYYKIEGISAEDYIACVHEKYNIFIGEWSNPMVLVHADEGKDYSLDASTAQFTLREYGFWDGRRLEYWLNLGTTHRKQILSPIEESVAQEFAKQLPVNPSEYVDTGSSESYAIKSSIKNEDGTDSYLYLWIEIYLEGYDNLLWCGEVLRAGDDYLIAIHQNKNFGVYEYIHCDDSLSDLIDQVVNEYGLVSTP